MAENKQNGQDERYRQNEQDERYRQNEQDGQYQQRQDGQNKQYRQRQDSQDKQYRQNGQDKQYWQGGKNKQNGQYGQDKQYRQNGQDEQYQQDGQDRRGTASHSFNRRALGTDKEYLAKQYLLAQGVDVLEANFYFHGGEVDLIARDGEYLCFIEVKYRKDAAMGYPAEAVGAAKQRRLVRGARQYLYRSGFSEGSTPCRFDVIAILGEEITWLKNAFTI